MSGTGLSRRGLLSAAGLAASLTGAALVGGCDLGPLSAPAPPTSPGPDPDASVVTAARAELSGLIAGLSATSGAAGLVACHRAQLAALGGHPRPVNPRSRPLTRARVIARERRAVARFTHWATTCSDGDLARVLASIAAGISMQHVLREMP